MLSGQVVTVSSTINQDDERNTMVLHDNFKLHNDDSIESATHHEIFCPRQTRIVDERKQRA